MNEHTLQIQKPTKKVPEIILFWDDNTQHSIPVLSLIRGASHGNKRPCGFFYEPNQPTYGITREEFMRWLHEEFIYIFAKDSEVFNTYLPLINYKM